MQGLDREGHLRLQRPLQPAALRQHLAAPGAAAASADLDPGRRLGRDLAVVRRDGLRLLLPLLLRLQGRPGDMEGFWDEMERLGKDRNPYRAGFLQFVGVAESRQQAHRALHRAGRVLLRPLPACRPALRLARRLHAPKATQRAGIESQMKQGGQCADADHGRQDSTRAHMEDIVDGGYVIIGSPGRGGRADPRRRPTTSTSAT